MRNSEKDPDPPTDDLCCDCQKNLQARYSTLCQECRQKQTPYDTDENEEP
jgi:hypothetical protein